MAHSEVKLKVSMAWWWKAYAWALIVCVALTGPDIDRDKLHAAIKRAIRVSVE